MRSAANGLIRRDHSWPVIVPGGRSANHLGVIRAFGRRRIPVIYLDSEPRAMARYSRFITTCLKSPRIAESEAAFVDVLLHLGRQVGPGTVIIPTCDRSVLALSRHKHELKPSYRIPVSALATVQTLLDKTRFYALLANMRVRHPKTFFPGDLPELRSAGLRIPRPYLIKPAHSRAFQEQFGRKCFVINSVAQLERAVAGLEGTNLDVMLQEIIPGNEIYMAYMYFNEESKPLAVCGYDKLRQFPPDFGSGSLCRSTWRPEPIRLAIQLLGEIGYHGIAEPEFKRDPRDGKYKLLEINVRTSLQNRLPAACGSDIEYMAYLDMTGQSADELVSPRSGVLWVDDFCDQYSCLIQLRDGRLGVREVLRSLEGERVHSVAAWDDPIPFLARSFNAAIAALRRGLWFVARIAKGVIPVFR